MAARVINEKIVLPKERQASWFSKAFKFERDILIEPTFNDLLALLLRKISTHRLKFQKKKIANQIFMERNNLVTKIKKN